MGLREIDKERIAQARKGLVDFIKSDRTKYSFIVDCELENRIRFIYRVLFPGFRKMLFYFRFLLSRIALLTDISAIKKLLYRAIGIKIGKGVFISPGVIIDPHFPELIEIEEYAILGWGVQLFPHEFAGNTYRLGRIRIKRGAVLGGYATVRGGVQIGEQATVSAFCIAYKDVPDNCVYDSEILLKKVLVGSLKKIEDIYG